jgi:hypothetical protein
MSDEIKKLEQPELKLASSELSEQDLENVAGGTDAKGATKAKGGTQQEYLMVILNPVLVSSF